MFYISISLMFMGAAMILDDWSFDRAEAASIVGLSEGQIGNWIARYGLFADRRPGRGAAISFRFNDLMTLATVKLLSGSYLCDPKNAIQIADYGSLYGLMRDRGNPDPGYLPLGLTEFGLRPFGNMSMISVRINLWSVYDTIIDRAFDAMRAAPGKVLPDLLEREILDARAALDADRGTM